MVLYVYHNVNDSLINTSTPCIKAWIEHIPQHCFCKRDDHNFSCSIVLNIHVTLSLFQNLNLDELMVKPDMTGSYWSGATSPFTFSWLLETQSPQPNPPLHPGPFHCVVDISHVTKNASPLWFDMVGSEVVTRLGITVKMLSVLGSSDYVLCCVRSSD